MANDNFKKALKIISIRQQKSRYNADMRFQEVYAKIPKIKELNLLLSRTSLKLAKSVFSSSGDLTQTINKIRNENLAIQEEIANLLIQKGYPADYLVVKYTCLKCEDSAYVDGKKCDCLTKLITKINVQDFNQLSNVVPSSFNKFSLLYYSEIADERTGVSPRTQMGDILNFCTRYSETFSKTSPSILMTGETGLGKTHLSLAIADGVVHKGYISLYSSSLDLFRTLQNEYFGKGEPNKNTMQSVLDADLLIIDDLGAEFESAFNTSMLYNIVNSRLNLNKPTIINTNLSLSQLSARYSDRVSSRLMTLYKCLKFVGKDIRQIKLRRNEL